MKHVRFSALAIVLVLSTIILTTIDGSQSFVFAQNNTSAQNSAPITPAPEPSGGDGDSNDDEASNSSGSDDSDDSNSEDGDSQQDTSSSTEEEEEDDAEQTNPLLEQITNRVNGALSADGIPVQ